MAMCQEKMRTHLGADCRELAGAVRKGADLRLREGSRQ
jgi:hypothetical protein